MWRLVKAELAYSWRRLLGLVFMWGIGLELILGGSAPDFNVPSPVNITLVLWFLMLAVIYSATFLHRERSDNRLKLLMTLPVSHSGVFLSRAIPMTILHLIPSVVAIFLFLDLTVNGAVINIWMVLSIAGLFLYNLYVSLFREETRFIKSPWGVVNRIIVILFTFSIILMVGFIESTKPYAWSLLSQPLGTGLCLLLAVVAYMVTRALFLRRESFIERV